LPPAAPPPPAAPAAAPASPGVCAVEGMAWGAVCVGAAGAEAPHLSRFLEGAAWLLLLAGPAAAVGGGSE
jgi:hypothetical protein